MARIPPLQEDGAATPAEARELLQAAKAAKGSCGRLVNLYRALASHPAVLRAFTALGVLPRPPAPAGRSSPQASRG